jgi:hypothetical protein
MHVWTENVHCLSLSVDDESSSEVGILSLTTYYGKHLTVRGKAAFLAAQQAVMGASRFETQDPTLIPDRITRSQLARPTFPPELIRV